jgi:radical SAM superfamily enzyme YgiQ (UPF0313 family)
MPSIISPQVTAPTLQIDLCGVFLARSLKANDGFGTHPRRCRETMEPYPALDLILRGEPEMTLRELIDSLENKTPSDPRIVKLLQDTGAQVPTKFASRTNGELSHILGLVWRKDGKIVMNPDRPFIPNLDDLPISA